VKIVVQRVKEAAVCVRGDKVGEIGKGFLILVGIADGDVETDVDYLAGKVARFRVFEDEAGKMNLDIKRVEGSILSVSQFTLLGDTSNGNRPGFDLAAKPDQAKVLWQKFNERLRENGIPVFEGVFGADMQVSLINDGPVTFIIESKK